MQAPEIAWETCPTCRREYTWLDANGICQNCNADVQAADDRAKRHEEKATAILGVKGYREFTFEQFQATAENRQALEVSRRFNPDTDNLYLWGNTGSGKSHLAYAIARKFLDQGKTVQLFIPPDLMRLFRKKEAIEELEAMNRINSADVLVIDDLGVGKATEFANQILYEIVHKRIMDMKNGLVVTSNLSIKEFAAKTDDNRLPDRMLGICRFEKLSAELSWRVKLRKDKVPVE